MRSLIREINLLMEGDGFSVYMLDLPGIINL